MSFPKYRQKDKKDCGPSCLKIISKYYGKEVSITVLRSLAETTRYGSNLYGLKMAAEHLGFNTMVLRAETRQLIEDIYMPVILHWNDNHFVVLYKYSKSKFFISDPAFGKIKYNVEDFEKLWARQDNAGHVMLLEPTEQFGNKEHSYADRINLNFIKERVLSNRSLFIQLLFSFVLITGLQFSFPFITQAIIDKGIRFDSTQLILVLLAGQLFFFLGRVSVELVRNWIMHYVGARIRIDLMSEFFVKLMKLPLSFFDVRLIGDLMQRVHDHKRIEQFLTSTSAGAIFSIFTIIVYSLILLFYNKMIFLVFAAGSIIYFLWIAFFIQKRRELDYKLFLETSQEQSNMIELIQGMPEIKINNAEKFKKSKWEKIQHQIFLVNSKTIGLSHKLDTGASVINELKNILIIFIAANMVITNNITLGMMLAINYITGQLNVPLNQLITLIKVYQDARISMERLNEVHSQKNEIESTTSFTNGDIHINHMSFKYKGAIEYALKDLNFIIPQKKVTAIVGSSGSGKSTLLKLLLQYYYPSKGNIKIGDCNIDDINPSDFRSNIGVVMQEGYIFNETIKNNILLGKQEDLDKLINSLKVANVYGYVNSLPRGMETIIGTEGLSMSSGQKQRILIARAIYKAPQILLFDEATSSLDSENESIIVNNLEQFLKGKTSIIVAHRLSTVKNADQIVVLDNGVIVQRGNHNELLKKSGKYASLINHQLNS
jgi:ATP-binding cassette, subfamily B, bacterial